MIEFERKRNVYQHKRHVAEFPRRIRPEMVEAFGKRKTCCIE